MSMGTTLLVLANLGYGYCRSFCRTCLLAGHQVAMVPFAQVEQGDGSIAVETDISGLLSALDVCCAEDTQESGTRAEILGYCWDASEDRYVRCEGYGTLHAQQLAFAKGDTQLAIAAPTRCGSVTIDTATLQPATATLTLCWNEAGRMELLRMRPEDFWSHLLLSALNRIFGLLLGG